MTIETLATLSPDTTMGELSELIKHEDGPLYIQKQSPFKYVLIRLKEEEELPPLLQRQA